MRAVRWGDRDRYLGPFTYARDRRYKTIGLVMSSAGDEDRSAMLRLSLISHTLIVALPNIIKPWRRWVDTSKYDWSSGPGSGYWDVHRREFGFSYSEGFLQVFLGPQTHDSSTTKNWCKFLPWTQWRHVRSSHYDLKGEHYWTEPKSGSFEARAWEARQEKLKACPTRTFSFADIDGEELTVRTRIDEREWRFGTGWFKWLSVFRKPRTTRSLDLAFSGETGKRKGSWKGGTIGHSITMLPGELHEAAFRRYCDEHGMTFGRESEFTATKYD